MSRPAVWPPRVSGNPANGYISMSTNDAFFLVSRLVNLAKYIRFYEGERRDKTAAGWMTIADDADLLAEALGDAATVLWLRRCDPGPIPVEEDGR